MPRSQKDELMALAQAEHDANLANLEKQRENAVLEFANRMRAIEWAAGTGVLLTGRERANRDSAAKEVRDHSHEYEVFKDAIQSVPTEFTLRDLLERTNGTPRSVVKAALARSVRRGEAEIVTVGKGKRGNVYRKVGS